MGQAGVMHFPAPLRAAVGLVATAADEARRLPDRALELPMLAVSTALQASVRAQQRYARLTARGDAVLHRGEPTDEPPPGATFDDPLPDLTTPPSRFDTVEGDELPGGSAARSARLIGELMGVDEPAKGTPNGAKPQAETSEPPARNTQPRKPPAKKTTASKSTTKKTAAKKASSRTARPSTSGSDPE